MKKLLDKFICWIGKHDYKKIETLNSTVLFCNHCDNIDIVPTSWNVS